MKIFKLNIVVKKNSRFGLANFQFSIFQPSLPTSLTLRTKLRIDVVKLRGSGKLWPAGNFAINVLMFKFSKRNDASLFDNFNIDNFLKIENWELKINSLISNLFFNLHKQHEVAYVAC
ncbi:MAG: hypothetical protein Q7S57_00910 [bacterium]|nr:hypothetical protein [bacterium]